MKPYEDKNQLDQALKSLNNRITISEKENHDMLQKINGKMDRYSAISKPPIQWKYYVASVATVLLIIIFAFPLLSNQGQDLVGNIDPNLSKGSTDNNPTVSDPVEEELIIHIMNYTPFPIEHMMVKVYKNGELKTSQGGMYADGSVIEPGDVFEFRFLESELGKGEVELELEIETSDTKPDEAEEEYEIPRMSLMVSDQMEYYLKLTGDLKNDLYLATDENNFEININNSFVDMIREEVELGYTQDQIENLLGNDYEESISEDEKSEAWRYDFGAKEGYKSPGEYYEYEDLEEIKNGAVQAILSTGWNEESKVRSYSVLYLDNKDGNVYSYRLFSDGREKLELVY